MINKISSAQTIRGLFETFKEQLQRNQGMLFTYELQLSNYGYEKDGNTYHEEWVANSHKFVRILVANPHSIFIAVADYSRDSVLNTPQPSDFTNLSNHDSCGFSTLENHLSKVWFEAYSAAYGHVPEAHRKSYAEAASCGYETLFPLFQKGITFVEITKRVNPESSYHYILTGLKKLEWSLKLG